MLTKSKIGSVHFVENLLKKEFLQGGFFYIFKIQHVSFLALKVIAASTQLFLILENFVIQKLTEKLGINPNFKKQNEDYRLTFDMNI